VQSEAITDLHQLSSAPDDLSARGEHGQRQEQGRRSVVDHGNTAGLGKGGAQGPQGPSATLFSGPGLDIELDIDVPGSVNDGLYSPGSQRCPAEVRVYNHARGIYDPPHARRPRGEPPEHFVDAVVDRGRAFPHGLLGAAHSLHYDGPGPMLEGGGYAVVAQKFIGGGDLAAGVVSHAWWLITGG
jgi:hypothetical protein